MTNMGRFHGTACILLTILVSLFTACGTGFQQRASTQPAGQTTTGDSASQPTTPSTPPAPTPVPTPPPIGPEHLYFTYSGRIYGFELHDDGNLTPTPNSPYLVGGDTQQAGGLSVTADGTKGFVVTSQDCPRGACYGTNSVSSFSIDASTGELTRLQVTPTIGPISSLTTNDSGTFGYAPSYVDGMRAFRIENDGTIAEIQGSPFRSVFGGLTRSPNGTFFGIGYRPSDFAGPFISSFRPDANGVPVALHDPTAINAIAPIASAEDAEGQFLFVLDDNSNNPNFHVFAVQSDSIVLEVADSPFDIVHEGRSFAIEPNRRWLYASGITDSGMGIVQYGFSPANGSLSQAVSTTPLPDVSSLKIDASGKYLIAYSLPKIYVFHIDPVTGGLSDSHTFSLF